MAKDLIIFDTCVFIKAFRKDREASLMLQNMQLQIAVSAVTVLELYFGAKTSIKKNAVAQLLDSCYIIPLNPAISGKAIDLIRY